MTSGNARSFRIFCGIIKSERVSVVHFPKQDIGWKEIRCLVSGPVRETATVGSCETAHCSVHDVARELLGSSRVGKPLAAHGFSPIGRADEDTLALQEVSQLASDVKGDLVGMGIRTAPTVCAGGCLSGRKTRCVAPVVRPGKVRAPTRMRHEIAVVGRIHRHGCHDAPYVVQANRALRWVCVPGQDRQNQ